MDLEKAFENQKIVPGLIGVEKIMFAYCGFTTAIGIVLFDQLAHGVSFMMWRVLYVAITLLLWKLYLKKTCDATYVLRAIFQVAMLGYWYPDIYNISGLMPNYDHIFAGIDQRLFGFQPAIAMSQALSGNFWSEIFYLGYFSYFPMIIVAILYALFFCYKRFDRTVTEIVVCFAIFYLVYLFLNVAGPQFYFPYIGMEKATAGVFPDAGSWFRFHPELLYHPETHGFFQSLVEGLHKNEYPIAAFPSSHVGLSTVIIILMYRMSKKLTLVALPFYVLLCLSTVYIGAHYAIDSIVGWFFGIFTYIVSRKVYMHRYIHRPKTSTLHHHHHHHHH